MRTKVEAPALRDLVSRVQLVDALTAGPPHKLTLVRAPAGSGKTSLLSQWRSSASEQRFAWLALESADNDPPRFWSYVVEALRSHCPMFGSTSAGLFGAPNVSVLEELLPALLAEFDVLPETTVLVLDDYHLIVDDRIHEGIVFLVEHLPANLRLAIASRNEPRLPLARLRARGELLEIDADHLRFSESETASLLNGVHKLSLGDDDVERLRQRTEGWAAGLYLAVLSLRGRDDPHAFIETFAGDDRYVVEYLGAEVLGDLPDELRTFLLRTSILDRLCGPLCAAVTGQQTAARLLGRIERSNYFLVPLDTRREWYRYHHLFADLLLSELQATEPDLVPELHRRAAAWLLEAGHVSEAIHHLISAGDLAEASELISEHWLEHVNVGQVGTVEGWLDALPAETVTGDGRLCLVKGWAAFASGRIDEVEPWAEAARRAPQTPPFRDGTTSLALGVAILLASFWSRSCDVERCALHSREALSLDAPPKWRAIAASCMAIAAFWSEDEKQAIKCLEEAIRLGRDGVTLNVMFCLGIRALVAARDQDWPAVERFVEEAVSLSADLNAGEYWIAGPARVANGMLLAYGGELEEAVAELEHGLALARRGQSPMDIAFALVALADVKRSIGKRADAREHVSEARRMLDRTRDPGTWLPKLVDDTARRLRMPSQAWLAGSIEELSEREVEVLRLFTSDLSQREIGDRLFISRNTVKSHSRSILRKLHASSRTEAVAHARDLGLL